MKRFLLIAISVFVLLTACAPAESAGPETAVEAYWNAINEKDSTSLSTLSCANWELDAMMALDAFQAVTTTLEDLECAQTGTEGENAIVTCQGKLVASYDGELQEFDLSLRTYLVENSTGEWLVCGER